MTINNITDFNNFLRANNLSHHCNDFNRCVNEYSALCSCRPDEKRDKLIECTRYYVNSIETVRANKNSIFNKIRDTKIEFYNDGKMVGVIVK